MKNQVKPSESIPSDLIAFRAQEVAAKQEALDAWGPLEPVNMTDILIPKILGMQQMSEFVIDGKAAFGDFCVSGTGKKLGSIVEPVQFIPFHLQRLWIVQKLNGNKFEFLRVEEAGMDPKELPWEWEEQDPISKVKNKFRRDYTYNYYVILPEEESASIPYVISFKRTSTPAAKQLYTQMFVNNRAGGLTPAGTVMALSGKKEKNDLGTFLLLTVAPARQSTPDEVARALQWKKSFSKAHVVVDNSDLVSKVADEATPF